MSSTLPSAGSQCCAPVCDTPSVIQVPGPAGSNGTNGTNGTNGSNAFTTVTVDFTMPGELVSVTATVADTSWMAPGEVVWVTRVDQTVSGYMSVNSVLTPTTVSLKNLKNSGTGVYMSNSTAGTVNVGSKITPGGLQGPNGSPTGAAGGDLKSTYPNPKILLANALGAIIAGNGTDAKTLAAGANGQIPAYDNATAVGIIGKTILPLAIGGDVQDSRIAVFDSSGTKPVPLKGTKMAVTANGALQASRGDPKGADAIDLQVAGGANANVASGPNAVLSGGLSNTSSGVRSVCSGGESNTASGQWATVGGGDLNQATARGATVGGGEGNVASTNNRGTIGGGQNNLCTGKEATIAGGSGCQATAEQVSIGGGDSNHASSAEATVAGGGANTASGLNSTVGGGQSNNATGSYTTVPGGSFAKAQTYGQLSHANGNFSTPGDAQTSEFVARAATPDANPVELFLDGASVRMSVPTNTSWIFSILLVARTSAGLSSVYKSEGAIENNAGATTIHAVTTTEIYDGAGLPPTPVVVDADDPNDALRITVTGIALTNIRWVAQIKVVECNF